MLDKMGQGEHVLMAGQTGSGKTTLAQRLLSARNTVIVIDTKGELRWDGFKVTHNVDSCFDMVRRNGIVQAHSILRPSSIAQVEQVFRRAYSMGAWDVCVDEVYMIGNTSLKSFPPHFIRMLTAGRSRFNTVWTLTQRPAFLPKFAMTEAKHVFVFELGFEDDAKYLLKNVGVRGLNEELTATLKGHQFLYYSRPSKALFKSQLNLSL